MPSFSRLLSMLSPKPAHQPSTPSHCRKKRSRARRRKVSKNNGVAIFMDLLMDAMLANRSRVSGWPGLWNLRERSADCEPLRATVRDEIEPPAEALRD